jgi:hypothetical protein
VSRDLDRVRSMKFFHESCRVWSSDPFNKRVVFWSSLNRLQVTTSRKRVNPQTRFANPRWDARLIIN